jgi:hypothetical protein
LDPHRTNIGICLAPRDHWTCFLTMI